MNCKEFKTWMLDKKACDPASGQSAQAHIALCAKCEKLYSLDLAMEKQFSDALNPISPPTELISKTKSCPTCGNENLADSLFCNECGEKL